MHPLQVIRRKPFTHQGFINLISLPPAADHAYITGPCPQGLSQGLLIKTVASCNNDNIAVFIDWIIS